MSDFPPRVPKPRIEQAPGAVVRIATANICCRTSSPLAATAANWLAWSNMFCHRGILRVGHEKFLLRALPMSSVGEDT